MTADAVIEVLARHGELSLVRSRITGKVVCSATTSACLRRPLRRSHAKSGVGYWCARRRWRCRNSARTRQLLPAGPIAEPEQTTLDVQA